MDVQPLRFIPEARNRLLIGAAVALQCAVFAIAPFAWAAGGLSFAVLLGFHAYGTVLGWLLIHEAIHLKLLAGRRRNDACGRVLAILFGCPFHILKVGHMAHHKHNRGTIDTSELIPHDARHPLLWGIAYYARILGLLYVSEVLAPFAFFAWRRVRRTVLALAKSPALETVLNVFTRPLISAIRIDGLLCIAVFAAIAAWAGGDIRGLLLLFVTRAAIVSYYDNAYHYGTDPRDPGAALNLSVPRVVKPLILNHNMHRIHHRYPAASWAVLPALFAREGERFDRTLASVAFDQLKGPVRRPTDPAS